MISIPQIAEGLSPLEREWILGWDDADVSMTFIYALTGRLLRKGLLVGPNDWRLTETGQAVREYLEDTP